MSEEKDNEPLGKNLGMRYKGSPADAFMGLVGRSLYLATQYIPFSPTEAQAISYNDGQYIDENNGIIRRKES